jgi:S-formylglutathione hydrolase FrmB
MLRRVVTAAWVIAFVATMPASTVAATTDPNALTLVSKQSIDSRTIDYVFRTADLPSNTPVRVMLPSSYAANPTQRYPVLYLLHGCCADYTSWTGLGTEQLTAGLPLIVVTPDGGPGGFYSDWYNFGAYGPPRWEDYHVSHLIPWIDTHFRTVANRGGRAIAGLSMGGFAMSYAARHPDLFVAAAAFSGAVDTNYLPAGQVDDAISALDFPAPPDAVWGDRANSEVVWRAHNPWDLAENLTGLKLTLRTGNGMPGGPYNCCTPDVIEMLVHQQSLDLHTQLDALRIPHVWDDYGPGCHCGQYWTRDLQETLPDLMATFAHPPPAPVPFTFRSAEPSYSVYGWSVVSRRMALEFSELSMARPGGFRLSGSGGATVTTARWYRPGALYRVTMFGLTQQRTIVRADALGRLVLNVALGPANPYQEYTAQAAAAGSNVYTTTVTVAGPGIR